MPIPEFRPRNESGHLIARDGYVLCFFFSALHSKVGPHIVQALDDFANLSGRRPLWHFDSEGDLKRVDVPAWQRLRAELTDVAKWPNYTLDIVDSPADVSGFHFEYQGLSANNPVTAKRPAAVSFLEIWAPTEISVEQLRDFAVQRAAKLPFDSGYCSPAFNASEGTDFHEAFAAIRKVCFRHPGMDVHLNTYDSLDLDSRLRGVYWLNFLQGPAAETAAALGLSPSFTAQSLGAGKTLLEIGSEPAAGDLEKGDILPDYRNAAAALEPRIYKSTMRPPGFSDEDWRRWVRRFLD